MNVINANNHYKVKRQATSLLCASMMLSAMSLSACHPKEQTNEDATAQAETKNNNSKNADDGLTGSDNATVNGINAGAMGVENPMSETTAAHVDSYEAEFVTKMLERQKLDIEAFNEHQSQLEEEKSASASKTEASAENSSDDSANSDNGDNSTNSDNVSNQADSNTDNNEQSDAESSDANKVKEDSSEIDGDNVANNGSDLSEEELAQLKALEKRPLVNVVFPQTKQLTATEISNQYRIALQSLYLPDKVPLPTQAVDTLLNIALLTTPVFDDPELAERLVNKMPALARMIGQFQQWQLHANQQSEKLKQIEQEHIKEQQAQSAKLDELVEEFDSKIKDYDEQIAKYEKRLKKFE